MRFENLGQTRSVLARNYLLHTPDAFIRAALPGMQGATAIVHAGPACGARFTEYTVEFEPGGTLSGSTVQRFCYVLSGAINVAGQQLVVGDYAYHPQGSATELVAESSARVIVIEKEYAELHGATSPVGFSGQTAEIPQQPLLGDSAVQVQTLLPDHATHDFAVNVMTFQPGASLSLVELHVMEHGLLMLEGAGIYRLDRDWHAVSAGDFIWMAPFCPQWFAALGKTPARYLIYKDWNRHPL